MDLAKRETPSRSVPQRTFRRETTMPRQATDLPGLEVNAQIHGADMSGAEELSRILGLADKVGQNVIGDVKEHQDNTDAAAATLDFATGAKNDDRFAKSHAYRDAWQLQGAKKLAIDVSTEVTDKFNARINDPDNPPTIQDLDQLFEKTVSAHLLDEHGQPLNFITPQAKATLGNALMKLKEELMPKAAKAIKTQTDTKLFSTTFANQLHERMTGQEIGAPPAAAPATVSASLEARSKPIPKGWKGNQEDAIQELGMTASEAAQFLKTGKDTRTAGDPGAADIKARIAQAESSGNESASNPKSSASGLYGITNGTFQQFGGSLSKKNDRAEQERVMDRLLNHNIAALSAAGINATPGNVYLAHFLGAGGAVNALKNPDAKVAAAVQKANPFTRGWKNADVIAWAQKKMGGASGVVIADGSEPGLKASEPAPVLRPGFDVEKFMASLPPSVDKGEAKTWLLGSLIAEASSSGDTTLLNGLEDSKRKDGFPSFTPDERLKIAETRERLETRNRVEADRKERELKEDNSKLVLQAMVEGKTPSQSWLADQSAKGRLDAGFVFSLTNHINEQAKSDAREARMEQRQDQAEQDNDLDAQVYAMEASRRAGILAGASYQEDLQRWRNGELGTGKKAAARLLRLQAATKSGQQMTEQNPEFAYYSGQLADNYKPTRDTGRLILMKPQAKVSRATYQAMVAYYAEKVHSGMAPGDAYREAVQKYGKNVVAPKDQLADIRAQMAALRAKKAAAGR